VVAADAAAAAAPAAAAVDAAAGWVTSFMISPIVTCTHRMQQAVQQHHSSCLSLPESDAALLTSLKLAALQVFNCEHMLQQGLKRAA
jgi:hypothetical protein